MTLAATACLLAVLTALACAIPGTFVVLKGQAMLIDGIGHAVLPGIAIGYLLTSDLDSPVLLATAAAGALVVALGTDALQRSPLVTADSALGLVFPALFAAGVILISTHMSHVHLDVHAVLVGDLNLAAFSNPNYCYIMAAVLGINALFLALTLPRLSATTFDADFCAARGVPTRVLHVIFMTVVACTATAAFHAAGAMLVIALMVFPTMTARLLTQRVPTLVLTACGVAAISAVVGFWVAYVLDAATSAAMTVTNAVVFVAVLIIYRLRQRTSSLPQRTTPVAQ